MNREVTPKVTRVNPESSDRKSFLGVCDLCWYFKDTKQKQVKEVFDVIACKSCYLSMKEINR